MLFFNIMINFQIYIYFIPFNCLLSLQMCEFLLFLIALLLGKWCSWLPFLAASWGHVCFHANRSSWESIFSRSPEVVTPLQLQCCQRLVELCKHCLLLVYKYETETRGSLSGIGTDWGNSRYLHIFHRLCVLYKVKPQAVWNWKSFCLWLGKS